MTEHPTEQVEMTTWRGEVAEIARDVLVNPDFEGECCILARAYLALLAAYEDRSAAFERAAADCVRLEGALAKLAGYTAALMDEPDSPVAQQLVIEAYNEANTALAATSKPVVEEENADG